MEYLQTWLDNNTYYYRFSARSVDCCKSLPIGYQHYRYWIYQ